MSRGDEAERAAIQIMGQRARTIDQISELMARVLENLSQKNWRSRKASFGMEDSDRGISAMNKFEIAEKYNEIGASKPKEFIKWLLKNLSERYKEMLGDKLSHMLEMFSHYEHAQRASDMKMYMPWEKDGQTVEPEHYAKEKEAFYKAEMPGVFKSLGMEDEKYMDPEMIRRAHILEDYICEMFEESYEAGATKGKRIDRKNFFEVRQRALDSIDFGVADFGFIFSNSGEDIEIVIRPKDEVERLAKAVNYSGEYPFLVREGPVSRGENDYYLIDPTNEIYRDFVVADMFDMGKERNKAKEAAKEQTASTDNVVQHEREDGNVQASRMDKEGHSENAGKVVQHEREGDNVQVSRVDKEDHSESTNKEAQPRREDAKVQEKEAPVKDNGTGDKVKTAKKKSEIQSREEGANQRQSGNAQRAARVLGLNGINRTDGIER